MKIIVISGFLGAGKTTFITELSKRTKSEIAILENELGSENIDGDRIKSDQDDQKINIWEMTEGCVCCSSKKDLALSILTISNSVDPEYLVIEPTGVGLLSNIINNTNKILYERISLGSPITIIDGNAWQSQARDYPEIFYDQLRNAKTVVVSKMENSSEDIRKSISDSLGKENPNATIISKPYKEMDDDWWEELLSMDFDGTIKESGKEGEALDTFSLKEASISSPADLVIFLENILKGHYGNIVRAKGCIKTKNEKLRFDLAGGNYVISGTDDAEKDQVVFIGKEIKRQDIRMIMLSSSDAVRVIEKRKKR